MIKRKSFWFAVGCMALLLVGSSFAYWSGKIAHTNVLEADKMEASVEEIFKQESVSQGTVEKKVSFKNNSSAAAFLRVSYGESWEIKKNNKSYLLSNQINGKDVANKNWKDGFPTEKSDWWNGNDGWFYYKKVLPPGESTNTILESVTFPSHSGVYEEYKDADYKLYFRMELLQVSDSESTLNSNQVNANSSKSVFGKEASISNNQNVSWK